MPKRLDDDAIDFDKMDAELEDAIRRGLAKGDANMVRAYRELRDVADAKEILKDIQIEIVPYTIQDKSLRKIVLEAPDYIVDEILDALRERRRLAEFGDEAL